MNVGNGKPLHEVMASLLGGGKLEEDNVVVGKHDTTINVDKEIKDPRQEQDSIDTANIIKSAPTRPDPNKKQEVDTQDVDGIADGVLVVTDPEISSEEFEEVADELQGIVDNAEAGELPFTDKYEGDYILSCPICGGTFVSETLLESGEDTCPICCKIPDAFVVNGRVESEEAAVEQDDVQEDIEHEENLEEPVEGEEELQEPPMAEEPIEEEDPNKKESVNMEGNKLEETKKLQEDEYEDYQEEQNALKSDYSKRVKESITQEVRNAFNDLKDILENESNDTDVDGFYFPSKAVAIVEGTDSSYHLNSAMDLTTANILNSVDDNDNIEEAIDELFADYDADSAYSWADNLVTVLGRLDFDIHDEDDWEIYDWGVNEDNTNIIEGAGRIGDQEFTFEFEKEDSLVEFYDFEDGHKIDIGNDGLINEILDLQFVNESKKVEGDLSKDLYGNEADKRTYNRLQNLDIYLEEYEQAVADKDESRIETAKSKIMGDIGYLIPALNIKGGAGGLVEYIKNTEFDFENKFAETVDTLNQFAEEYRKEYEESKKVEGKKLNEEYYEDGIYAEIEDALRDAGFDIQRFSDAGVLTRNLGWIVYNENGERADITCDGTYLGESKKLTEGEDTKEATEIFINGLDKAVNTQSIVNAECMDEFFQNAKGILQEVAENNDVILESKEKKEEYVEVNGGISPLNKDTFGSIKELEQYINDEGYEIMNDDTIPENATQFELFDPRESDGNVYVFNIETKGNNIVAHYSARESWNMNESKKEEAVKKHNFAVLRNGINQGFYCVTREEAEQFIEDMKAQGLDGDYKIVNSGTLEESKVNYEYLDSNDIDNLGSDAELITDLYNTLGKDVDEGWDNVMADMDNEVLKVAEKDGKKYFVYDDGSLKGYSLGRASNNAPISKMGSLEECISSKAVLGEDNNFEYTHDELVMWVEELQYMDATAAYEKVYEQTGNRELADDVAAKIESMHDEAGILDEGKSDYEYVVQGNYGYGWDDLVTEETMEEAKKTKAEYDENETNVPHRIKTRRKEEESKKVEEEKLVEELKTVWSSEGEYITDPENPDFKEWLEANGFDEEIEAAEDEDEKEAIIEDFLNMYNENDNEVLYDDWQENIIPMIANQLDNNDLLIMLGTAQTWNRTGAAGKILRGVDDFNSLVADYDIVRLETDEANDLTIDLVHHDGTHSMDLYTFNGDTEGVYNKLIELGINEFSNDEYEDFDDAYSYYDAGDFLDYLMDGYQEEMKEFLVPIKWQ